MKHHPENQAESIFKRLFTFNARNIILAGMLGLLVLTGVMTWLTLSRIESIERKDLGHTLKNILLVTEESIYNWYLARKAYIETRTTSQQLRDLTKSLLASQKNRTTLPNDPALEKIRHLIGESLLMHGYLDFFIIAPDYTNIATLDDTLLGKQNPVAGKSDYLDKVFRGHFQLTHPLMPAKPSSIQPDSLDEAQPTMFLCAPIKDETDAVIAAMALQIDPGNDFSHIVYIGRFGETGDTYAFNRSGNLLTQSRYEDSLQTAGLLKADQQSVLNVDVRDPGGDLTRGFQPLTARQNQPLTRMAMQATGGHEGIDLDGYRDYRGVNVVGIWTWMDALDMGLATEIDHSEAYHSLHSTRFIVLVGLGVVVGMFLLFSILILQNNKKIRQIALELENANQQLNHSHQKLEEQHNELKKTQAQLVHSEKMAGLGTLVAGVAHEVNNPTNFVGSCSHDLGERLRKFHAFILEMLGENPEADTVQMFDDKFAPLFKDIDAIKDGGDRIKQIIAELKLFSRIDESEMKPERLQPGLESTITLVETQHRHQMQILSDFRANPLIKCWPAKLNQVFMNLMVNAAQTISQKKKRIGDDFQGQLHITTFEKDNTLGIRFKDNGEGIPEKNQSKLFEPFFTTKPVGQGTGLGLSISYGIVDEHGGEIEVDSTTGTGTTFTVYLPLG